MACYQLDNIRNIITGLNGMIISTAKRCSQNQCLQRFPIPSNPNPIPSPTYSFRAFKPFYGHLKQPKQTKADQCRPQCGENTGSMAAMLRGKLSKSEESYQKCSISAKLYFFRLITFPMFPQTILIFFIAFLNFSDFPHCFLKSS